MREGGKVEQTARGVARRAHAGEEAVAHDAAGMMRWLLTYADMITLLLVFFIVLYAASSVNAKKFQEVASSIRGAFGVSSDRSQINTQGAGGERLLSMPTVMDRLADDLSVILRVEIQEGKVEVLKTSRGLLLRFSDPALFDLGRADLTGDALRILDKIFPLLKHLPNPIEAEGHTDDLPIRSSLFPSNWELSTARATSVVRYFVEAHQMSPERLTARGMGEYRPLSPNVPRRGQPKNRRVEINILR